MHGPIASTTIIMLTSYSSNIDGFSLGTGGFCTARTQFGQGAAVVDWPELFDVSNWVLRTNSFPLVFPIPTTMSGLTATFFTDGSLNQNGLADFLIYDIHARVSYTDGTGADIYPSAVSAAHIGMDCGSLQNTALAIDGSLLTYAELTRTVSRSLLRDFTYFTVAWA